MKRRWFLHTGISAAVVGMAGCGSLSDNRTITPNETEGTTPNVRTTQAQPDEPTKSNAPTSIDPTFQTKLAPEDVEPDNHLFGSSVAISNDIILIGFPRGPNGDSSATGNVYVYTKSDEGLNQQAILTADNGSPNDHFGFSVALSENASIALIGAFESGAPNGPRGGSAYVFQRSGDTWSQKAKLAPDDGNGGDGFGVSVALADDGSTALIGAYRDEDPNGRHGGSAYVFDRSGSGWTQQAKLTASDGDSVDWFGVSVSLSDNLALVGASRDEDPNGEDGGSAYVFERSGNEWLQRSKLTANDGNKKDSFGEALALNGETAFIGAFSGLNDNGERAGAVYIFKRGNGRWSRQTKLTGKAGEGFGKSIDLSNNLAIFGAFADNQWTGSAYVYQRTEERWTQEAKIAANDGDSEDWFGRAVAIDSDTAIVGANRDEDPNGRDGGSVYVFNL